MPEILRFAAYCESCDWQGRIRGNNLTAMGDYDAHLQTDGHVLGVSNRPPEPGDLILGTFDPELRIADLEEGLDDATYAVSDQAGDQWVVMRDREHDQGEHRAWVAV